MKLGKSLKRGRSARGIALDLLLVAERPGERVDERLRTLERGSRLEARDRAFLRELVYGTLRWRGHLDLALSPLLRTPLEELPGPIRNLLRLGAYQILFTDRVPARAAVNEAVLLARERGFEGLTGLVNGVLRNLSRTAVERGGPRGIPPRGEVKEAAELAASTSHPPWMVERWVARWGLERAGRICRANNELAPLTLRVNRRRATPDLLEESLREAGCDVKRGVLCPEVLRVVGGPEVSRLPGYREGWFLVQDEAATLMGHVVSPRPGQRVWDACGGPGGKATHLAELMEDEGWVLTTDLHGGRLRRVGENARRLGLKAVTPVRMDVLRGGVKAARFDVVLLDAPCSGLGVLRRHPEAKWNKREEDIRRLAELEISLLREVAHAVAPGGRLVYCVCSNEPEETRGVLEAFADDGPLRFSLESPEGDLPWGARRFQGPGKTVEVLPGDAGTDGFFVARWRRRG